MDIANNLRQSEILAALRRGGAPAIVAGACSAASSLTFILALQHVTVANALFMGGIAPFITAIGALVLLKEPVAGRTWAAMVLGALGVAVMLGQGLSADGLVGNLLAYATLPRRREIAKREFE